MDTKSDLETLQRQSRDFDTETFLAWSLERFSSHSGTSLSFATSLGAEDQVLLWLLQKVTAQNSEAHIYRKNLEVFSLDTGRLPEETYSLLHENRSFFELPIVPYFPLHQAVESMIAKHGVNLFYESIELRKSCCYVRKVEPLKRALLGKSAWITGQRRSQSVTRSKLERIEWDDGNQMFKLNPLADWSSAQVWQLIREKKLPYNKLHDQGYPSLGCAPCTRAVTAGEDERSGRWWWESPENKECGLHIGEQTKPAKFEITKISSAQLLEE